MSFADLIWQNYPELKSQAAAAEKILTILTDFKIELPVSVLDSAQEIVNAFFKLRQSEKYRQWVRKNNADKKIDDPKNFSVLMGYDFHVSNNELKLIEINTNASSSLLVDLLYRRHSQISVSENFRQSLKNSFFEEAKAKDVKVENSAIVDENVLGQNAYFEFLMFKTLFERWGWTSQVCEAHDFEFNGQLLHKNTKNKIDLVYNRLTDFYLASEKNSDLKKAFDGGTTCFSPNPHEYFLLADKGRLRELSTIDDFNQFGLTPKESASIKKALPKVFSFKDFPDSETLWKERKKYFFKPAQAFGGKGAFRGESISRRLFNEIHSQDYLAQEFVPAGIHEGFKYDLRFYVYKNEIQLIGARVYQGQATNFQTPGTGLGIVKFI